jgi:hypothetical protein
MCRHKNRLPFLALRIGSPLFAGENLLRNAGSEPDADGDGVPDEWRASGATPSVTQQLSIDTGHEGKRCGRPAA